MLNFKCAYSVINNWLLFSAVSPRKYKRESKQVNDAILSKLRADSFTMPDPQVPVDAVQEAQAVLQNPAPGEAQAPALQAQAPAQANEVSLEVCETLLSLSFASCSVLVLEYFVSVVRFCFVFVRPVFTLPLFMWVLRTMRSVILFICGLPCCERFAGYFVFEFINCLPCCWRFALFVGCAGYILLWFVIRPASNVFSFFEWALRAVLFTYVLCPAVNGLSFLWALRAIFCFDLLFALLLNVCPCFVWALRAVLCTYVICPAVNDLPFLWAVRAIICFDLLFALLLNVCPLFVWALRAVLFTYVICPAVFALLLTSALLFLGFAGNSNFICFICSSVMRAMICLLFAVLVAFSPLPYRLCRPFYFSVLALRATFVLILFTVFNFVILFLFLCYSPYFGSFTYFLIFAFCLLRLSFFPVWFCLFPTYPSCFSPCPLFGLCGRFLSSCYLTFLMSKVARFLSLCPDLNFCRPCFIVRVLVVLLFHTCLSVVIIFLGLQS